MDEDEEILDAEEENEEVDDNEVDVYEWEDENDDDDNDNDEYDVCEDLSSPLIAAAITGDFTTLQSLLERGTDKNEITNWGCTALWHAARNGHSEVVRLLLERGCEKHLNGGQERETALGAATSFEGGCPLPVVQLLVEHGADIEAVDNSHWTPLNNASYFGHINVVRYLLEKGADRDTTTTYGQTSP